MHAPTTLRRRENVHLGRDQNYGRLPLSRCCPPARDPTNYERLAGIGGQSSPRGVSFLSPSDRLPRSLHILCSERRGRVLQSASAKDSDEFRRDSVGESHTGQAPCSEGFPQ